MTKNQFRKMCQIARERGEVRLPCGSLLVNHGGTSGWALIDENGQTVDTSFSPLNFMYICDDYEWPWLHRK